VLAVRGDFDDCQSFVKASLEKAAAAAATKAPGSLTMSSGT
jgi:threonine synthase